MEWHNRHWYVLFLFTIRYCAPFVKGFFIFRRAVGVIRPFQPLLQLSAPSHSVGAKRSTPHSPAGSFAASARTSGRVAISGTGGWCRPTGCCHHFTRRFWFMVALKVVDHLHNGRELAGCVVPGWCSPPPSQCRTTGRAVFGVGTCQRRMVVLTSQSPMVPTATGFFIQLQMSREHGIAPEVQQ